MKRKREQKKKKKNTASLAPLSFTPTPPPSVPAPPQRSSPSLSHIFTYGDWGGGRAATLGGERIEEWSFKSTCFTFFFYSLYLFRMKRKREQKKKKNTASLAPSEPASWGEKESEKEKELLRSPNKFILNLYVFYCAEPGSWFAGENYRSWLGEEVREWVEICSINSRYRSLALPMYCFPLTLLTIAYIPDLFLSKLA